MISKIADKTPVSFSLHWIGFFYFLLSAVNCYADDWKTQVIKQLNGGSAFVQDPYGNSVFSHNAEKLMVPASILKIATADAVMTYLGKDYRIPTEVFLTADNYLAIKGYGDPTLTSESLSSIAAQIKSYLKKKKSATLNGFWFDTSFFKASLEVDGQSDSNNPYDSTVGALVANFNTVNIKKLRNGVIRSAEPQTPLTPTAVQLGKKLSAGKHRINLGKRHTRTLRYFAELLQAFLKKESIDIAIHIINKPIPEHSIKLFTHQSQAVSEIVQKLMSFSNNFIANQLLIILGGEQKGVPADLDKGKQVLSAFLTSKIGINNFILEEGSGLSRKNQFTAAQMMKVLIHFQPHQELLRLYQSRFQAKTGTLKGISTYAGYMISPTGDNYPFVIMLNKSRWGGERNKVTNLLYKGIFQNLEI